MAFIPSSGSVVAFQSQPSSLLVGASIIGAVPVTGFPTTQNVSGSVFAVVQALQGASVSGTVGASIIGLTPVSVTGPLPPQSVSGTVGASIIGVVPIVVTGTLPAQSISGVIVENAPTSSWVSSATSVFTGVIQPVIAAQGTSIFTYVTGVQVANNSANAVYVSFLNGIAGSIIGYTIAPANGGSNITMPNALKTLANGAFSASISGVASVFVTAEGFTQNT